MKVCFFTPIFPPKYSGATFQAINLAKLLRDRGHSISFMKLVEGVPYVTKYQGFDVFGISVKSINKTISGKTSLIADVNFYLRLMCLLFRLRNKYEIIHSHVFAYPFLSVGLIGKLFGKKTLAKVTMTNEVDLQRVGKKLGALSKLLGSKFDALVAINSEVEEKLNALYGRRVRIEAIPNGVDTTRFHPLSGNEKRSIRKSLGLRRKRIVTYVGAISYRKGVDLLVKMWRDVAKECPDSLLILIGPRDATEGVKADTSCFRASQEFVANAGLEKQVIFTGRIKNVEKYLQASDIMVLPSYMEGMPNSILEAMACGIPVVSFHISGVEDVIRNGIDGELVNPGSAQSFKNAIVRLLKDESLRNTYSRKAVQNIKNRFSIDSTCYAYERLYEQLLDQK